MPFHNLNTRIAEPVTKWHTVYLLLFEKTFLEKILKKIVHLFSEMKWKN